MAPCAVGNRHQPLSFVEHCLDSTSDSHFQPIFSPILLNSLSTYVEPDRLRLGLTLNFSITGKQVVMVHIFACALTLSCPSFGTEISKKKKQITLLSKQYGEPLFLLQSIGMCTGYCAFGSESSTFSWAPDSNKADRLQSLYCNIHGT